MFSSMPDPVTLSAIVAALVLVPFVAVMATSFVKLAVVFSLVRNALGVQQVPPNMALYGLSIILTVYIMAPVAIETYGLVQSQPMENVTDWVNAGKAGAEPFRQFLTKHTTEAQRLFFMDTTRVLWKPELAKEVDANHMMVLIPAFTVSELTEAFEIGFLLYLPFIAIDLIVSNILLAMGMMMVSPMTISLPLKLFLFVMIDGWSSLIHGLVLTYQ